MLSLLLFSIFIMSVLYITYQLLKDPKYVRGDILKYVLAVSIISYLGMVLYSSWWWIPKVRPILHMQVLTSTNPNITTVTMVYNRTVEYVFNYDAYITVVLMTVSTPVLLLAVVLYGFTMFRKVVEL